jgi:hypothetical protein
VHHVPIAAGRKRIDTAIKTRCPRASHFIYYSFLLNIIDGTRGKRPPGRALQLSGDAAPKRRTIIAIDWKSVANSARRLRLELRSLLKNPGGIGQASKADRQQRLRVGKICGGWASSTTPVSVQDCAQSIGGAWPTAPEGPCPLWVNNGHCDASAERDRGPLSANKRRHPVSGRPIERAITRSHFGQTFTSDLLFHRQCAPTPILVANRRRRGIGLRAD